jgi:hypothetical protein
MAGLLDVVPPDTLATPEIPVISDSITAITETAPPVGYFKDEPITVSPYDWQDFIDWLKGIIEASNLSEESYILDTQKGLTLGDESVNDLADNAAEKLEGVTLDKLGVDALKDLENIQEATNLWASPKAKLSFYLRLGFAITTAEGDGKIQGIKDALDEMSALAEDGAKNDFLANEY